MLLQAFDSKGNSSGQATGNPNTDGFSGTSAQLSISAAGIASVRLTSTPGNFVLSSVAYGTPPAGPTITAAKNSANYVSGTVAPGEIVDIFGSGLGPAQLVDLTLDNNGNVATQLSGTSVSFGGIPAPIVYTLATQVAVVVPYEITGASVSVTLTYQGQPSNAFPVTITQPSRVFSPPIRAALGKPRC